MRIPNIDRLPPQLGPALHALTDETNAMYKNMVYIYSLPMATDGSDNAVVAMRSDKDAEMLLVERLRDQWQEEMGEERFAALITRLCVVVVSVQ